MNVPIVSRKVLLPIELLYTFSSDTLRNIHTSLIETEKKYEKKKSVINDLIYGLIKKSTPSNQKILLNIKRKVFNNKNLSTNEIEFINAIQFTECIDLHELKNIITKKRESLKDTFSETTNFEDIKNVLKSDEFQLSLYMASQSLYRKIPKFLNSNVRNKEIRKEEINFLNYIYRAITKPTPFACFTSLSATDLKGASFNQGKYHYFINEQILRLIWESIRNKYFERLPLNINPTLSLRDNSYKFVTMARGVEEINSVEVNETLNELYKLVAENHMSIKDIYEYFGSENIEVKNFIVHLIDLGLFEFNIPFILSSETKLIELSDFFQSIQIEETDIHSKLIELDQIKTKLCSSEIGHHIELIENANQIAKEIFKTLDIDEYMLNTYNLFFLDTSYTIDKSPINISEYSELFRVLRDTNMIDLTYFEKENIRFKYYEYKKLYDKNDIYLIDFYRYYFDTFYKKFKEEKENGSNIDHIRNPLGLDSIEEIREKSSDLLKSRLKRSVKNKNGVVYYPVDNSYEYASISEKPSVSLALYTQKVNLDGETLFVMNANLSGGFGQWISRFTRIFNSEFTQRILDGNKAFHIRKGAISRTNFFNANIRKPITEYDVLYPNSVKSGDTNISIGDLKIIEYNGFPVLSHNDTPIDFLHMGFQYINGMPPLYQLMTHFNSTVAKQVNIIDEPEIIDEFVTIFPRQILGTSLVIRRKTWETKRNVFQDENYLELLDFKTKYDLPDRVFYQFILTDEDRSNPKKADGKPAKKQIHKPKYMDFYNPTSIRCFFQHIKDMAYNIDFTEMLPDIKDIKETHITEHLLQFNYDNKSYSRSEKIPESENDKWLSHFIYVPKNQMTQVITETLSPVFTLSEDKNIPLFFVRYRDEKGDHLRLRIMKSDFDNEFNTIINNQFKNSAMMGIYEAEYSRYGGLKGKQIAIEHFNYTSHLIRKIYTDFSDEHRLHIAYETMSLFFEVLALNLNMPVHELSHYYRQGYEDILEDKNDILFLPKIEFNHVLPTELKQELKTHLISILGSLENIVPEPYKREHIYTSYIHMFNNKLGISIPEEVKLAYCIELQFELITEDI